MRHYVVTAGRSRVFDDRRQRWTPGGVAWRKMEPTFRQALDNLRLQFEGRVSEGALATMARVLMDGDAYQFQDPGIEVDWVEIEECRCQSPATRHHPPA